MLVVLLLYPTKPPTLVLPETLPLVVAVVIVPLPYQPTKPPTLDVPEILPPELDTLVKLPPL